MEFKEWLIQEGIAFTGWFSDGTINVNINGKKYVYEVEKMFHAELKKLAKYKPFTALNKIKDLIKAGRAKQVSPIEAVTPNLFLVN